jgi:hypothetical protein
MSTTHWSLTEETTTVYLPLFHITLPRISKANKVFKLTSTSQLRWRHIRPTIPSLSVTVGKILAKPGQTVNTPPPACVVVVATFVRNAQREITVLQNHNASTLSWWKVKNHTLPTVRAASKCGMRSDIKAL